MGEREHGEAAYGYMHRRERGEARYGHSSERERGEGAYARMGEREHSEAGYGYMPRLGQRHHSGTAATRLTPASGAARRPAFVDMTGAPVVISPLHDAYNSLKTVQGSGDPLRITAARGRLQEAAQIAGGAAVAQLRAEREASGDTHHDAYDLLGQLMESV